MRQELRYVFDDGVSKENVQAKDAAVEHLEAMKEPRAWIHEQVSFDAELARVGKISEKECARRYNRWITLLSHLKESVA